MNGQISRRAALILSLAAAPRPITDAIGHTVTLKAPAARIVLGFNDEEFTAIGGAAARDRVVGFNRPSLWVRSQKAIPRLTTLREAAA